MEMRRMGMGIGRDGVKVKDSGQGVVGRGAFADGENIFQKVIHLWSSSFAWSNPSKDIDLLRSCFPLPPSV